MIYPYGVKTINWLLERCVLFHLSSKDDLNVLFPRVPTCPFQDENGKTVEDTSVKRVCFSTSITGALHAIQHRAYPENGDIRQFVYVVPMPQDIQKRKKCRNGLWKRPNFREVPDAYDTGEIWVLKPIKVVGVGEVFVGKDGTLSYDIDGEKVKEVMQKRFENFIFPM